MVETKPTPPSAPTPPQPTTRPVGIPASDLPQAKPPQLVAGHLLVLALGGDAKWHYAAVATGPGSALPQALPEPLPPDPVNPALAPLPGASVPALATPT
jgi:hypothetical protein